MLTAGSFLEVMFCGSVMELMTKSILNWKENFDSLRGFGSKAFDSLLKKDFCLHYCFE
jgi:hypothetical protein